MWFVGLALYDPVPDAKTIWLYCEQLARSSAPAKSLLHWLSIRNTTYPSPVPASNRSQNLVIEVSSWRARRSGPDEREDEATAECWRVMTYSPVLSHGEPESVGI
jgi:hypothetical protein